MKQLISQTILDHSLPPNRRDFVKAVVTVVPIILIVPWGAL